MSWISPTFGGESSSGPGPPPKKKSKTTTSTSKSKPSSSTTITSADLTCNWLQTYKPQSMHGLAVNVKKVQEVETWLQQATSRNSSKKFLLMTGPSGCGKTATLQTICKDLGIKILEWITPLDKPEDDFEGPSRFQFSKSATKMFEEYLLRSSRYNSCLSSNPVRKLVLVKDFPNVFLHNPSTFHEVLENFSEKCVNPIVFICSDESHCRKLFSTTVKAKCQIQTITFNPIPDQRMMKVLKPILLKESNTNKNIKMLSDEAILTICIVCHGDLRSAISKLYFCSIQSDFDIAQLKPRAKLKKASSANERTPSDKDTRIDFFHGIGRVLYPKKISSDKDVKFLHSTETIVENFLCEPKAFIGQLHENYPTKFGNMRDLSDAAERLSTSDILMTRWQDKDIFQTYSLAVAVQGLMVCNKTPEKGKFEAFRKSQTSRLEIDSKAIELEGKAMFSDLAILDYESLVDILPYSRFLLPDLNQGQLEYVRKTCYFK